MKLIVTNQSENKILVQTIVCTKNCKYVQLRTFANWWTDNEVTLSCEIDTELAGWKFGEFTVDESKADKARAELEAFCSGLAFTILNEYETYTPLSLTQAFQNFVKSEPWVEEDAD